MFVLIYLKYISSTYLNIYFNTIRYKKQGDIAEDVCYKNKFYILYSVINVLDNIEMEPGDRSDLNEFHNNFCTAIVDLYQSDHNYLIAFKRFFKLEIVEFKLKLKEGTWEYYKNKTRNPMKTRELEDKQEMQLFIESLYNFYTVYWMQLSEKQYFIPIFHCYLYMSLYMNGEPLFLDEMNKRIDIIIIKNIKNDIELDFQIKNYVLLEEFKDIQNEIFDLKTNGIRLWDMIFFFLELFDSYLCTRMLDFKFLTTKLDQVFKNVIIALCVTKRSNCSIFIISDFKNEKGHLNLRFHTSSMIDTLSLYHIITEINDVIQVIRKFPKSANKEAAEGNFYLPRFKKARNICYDKIKSILISNGFTLNLEDSSELVIDIPMDNEANTGSLTLPKPSETKLSITRKSKKLKKLKYLQNKANEKLIPTDNSDETEKTVQDVGDYKMYDEFLDLRTISTERICINPLKKELELPSILKNDEEEGKKMKEVTDKKLKLPPQRNNSNIIDRNISVSATIPGNIIYQNTVEKKFQFPNKMDTGEKTMSNLVIETKINSMKDEDLIRTSIKVNDREIDKNIILNKNEIQHTEPEVNMKCMEDKIRCKKIETNLFLKTQKSMINKASTSAIKYKSQQKSDDEPKDDKFLLTLENKNTIPTKNGELQDYINIKSNFFEQDIKDSTLRKKDRDVRVKANLNNECNQPLNHYSSSANDPPFIPTLFTTPPYPFCVAPYLPYPYFFPFEMQYLADLQSQLYVQNLQHLYFFHYLEILKLQGKQSYPGYPLTQCNQQPYQDYIQPHNKFLLKNADNTPIINPFMHHETITQEQVIIEQQTKNNNIDPIKNDRCLNEGPRVKLDTNPCTYGIIWPSFQ